MKIQKTFDIGEKSSRKSTICIQSNKISGCYHLLLLFGVFSAIVDEYSLNMKKLITQ